MSRPLHSRPSFGPPVRINGKIRAREVRVIGQDGRQIGILPLAEAINLARSQGVDLVEIAPTAQPPVCRIVDYGKFRYEQAKKEKDSKKHQHASRVKEIQISASIDPHDFKVKLGHAIDFLCDDMKVKVTLRFRGREMMHKEFGFQQVNNFVAALAPYAHPDSEPKLVGRGVSVMLSPLPRHKRAKHPKELEAGAPIGPNGELAQSPAAPTPKPPPKPPQVNSPAESPPPSGFVNNPFAQLNLDPGS